MNDDSPGEPTRAGAGLWLIVLACAFVASVATLFVVGSRYVMKSLDTPKQASAVGPMTPPPTLPATLPPAAPTDPPDVAPEPERAVGAGVPEPPYTAEDGRRTAEDAGRDFLAAVQQGDGKRLVKYALRAKRADYESEDDALRDLRAMSFDEARVVKSRARDDKAVLIVAARVKEFTDDKGNPSPVDVVLQLQREDGHWKLFRQQWLVATPLAEYEQEAMSWLESQR